MMTARILLFLALACVCTGTVSCSKVHDPHPPGDVTSGGTTIPAFTSQPAPSSERSREAITRVAPLLVRALQANGLSYGAPIFIRIFKNERELELWVRQDEAFQLFRTYEIVAMSGTLGPKQFKGDYQAPEGFYSVSPARMNPNSSYHLSFNLGYPNAYDRAHHRTGSALMVHGDQVSIGCYAMTDAKIEEIYCLADAALRDGQKEFQVHCFPFRMTAENMERHAESEWMPFWENLKEGYDWFEERRQPPEVGVREERYVFGDAEP